MTIAGNPATLNASTGNYEAGVPIGFGMNFVDVVATDQNGVQNSTTCFVLAAGFYSSESQPMPGAVALRLDPYAIGDPNPSGLNSLNDLFYTVLSSSALRTLVDQALVAANPINDGSCGIFACTPDVNYNSGSIAWDQPSTSLSLIPGGLRANVTLPNVRLNVSACGTTCCIGGSNIKVTADSITATVDFSLTLQGGRVRTAVTGTPTVTVGTVTLNGSGFCGFIINLVQSFFTGTVKNAVQSSLQKFINNNVGPMLDQIDVEPRHLDARAVVPGAAPRRHRRGRPRLRPGVLVARHRDLARVDRHRHAVHPGHDDAEPAEPRDPAAHVGSAARSAGDEQRSQPVGLSAYEGVLNEVLHALWRGGYFQATLNIGGGTATIDSWLPPAAVIGANNTAELMLGGVSATLTIPGIIDHPIQIMFGGHANATVTMSGDSLVFGNLALDKLYVSFQVTLSQSQRTAMESFLTSALQDVLASAINNGLPALPDPVVHAARERRCVRPARGRAARHRQPGPLDHERARRARRPVRSPLMRTYLCFAAPVCVLRPAGDRKAGELTLSVTSPTPGDELVGQASIAVTGTVATTNPSFGVLQVWVDGTAATSTTAARSR